MSRAGATLPEVTVALFIMAVIVTAGYAAFGQVSDGHERATRHLEPAVTAAGLRNTLTTWISSARVSGEEDGWAFVGVDGGGAAHDELRFVSWRADPIMDEPARIRLFIDVDPSTPERGLMAELTRLRGGDTPRLVEIAPWISDLQARYLVHAGEERRWAADWLSSLQLPAAVELTLSAAAPDSTGPLAALPLLIPLARQDTL